MFIREVKKKNTTNGKIFYQYQLVQASRIDGKVKQHNILYLGSESMLADAESRKKMLEILQAKIFRQSLLFAEDYSKEIVALADKYYNKFLIKYKDIAIDSAVSIPPLKAKLRWNQ